MPRQLALAALLSAALTGPLQAQTADRPAAVSGLLRLDVVALDRRDAPVLDLRPSELEVWVSGFRVPVTEVLAVTPASHRRTMVLLLDNVAVGPTLVPRIKAAARQLVEKMADGDRAAVVTLSQGTAQFTADRAALLGAIDAYRAQSLPLRADDTAAHALRTLETIARQMPETFEGRKAIVAIGAGWLFDTPMPPPGASMRDLQREWIAAMRAMAGSHTSLYVIDPVGVGAVRGADAGTSGFARETGGQAYLNVNDPATAVDRILGEIGSYYVLTMSDPPVQRAADLREVEVKVFRAGVTVRARRGIKGR